LSDESAAPIPILPMHAIVRLTVGETAPLTATVSEHSHQRTHE
jgi:hypothetical protein